MKLSIAMLASLVGMIGTSVGVSWVMGPPASAATAAPPAQANASAPTTTPAVASNREEPPRPTFVADGVLRVEGRVGHAVLPAGSSHETFVMLDVSAPKSDGVESRAPVNVAIVLDRSASMRGRRMTNAIAGVRGMLAQLRPDDTVSIVAYADRADLLLPPSTMRSLDLSSVSTMLDRVRAGGHTCISCGIELARAQLRSREGAVSRMLLLSDGQANRGIVDPSGFRTLADEVRRERAAIASIGVDIDYDERTLFALSEASNGRHYFVQNPSGLAAVFDDERRALVGTVADRTDVAIVLGDGVELIEVVDRPHRLDDDRVTMSLGTFAAGEAKTALLRVRVAPGASTVADVRLAYRDLVGDRDASADGVLGVRFDDAVTESAPVDPVVDARLGRKDTFDALLEANAAFTRGDIAGATRELASAASRVTTRRKNSGDAEPTVAKDFDRQLDAIQNASTGFQQAARDAPAAMTPARTKKGKVITRKNASVADPFSD